MSAVASSFFADPRLRSLLDQSGVTFAEPRCIPTEHIRRMLQQPRQEFDPSGMQSLTDSIGLVGQLQDGLVRPLSSEELVAEQQSGSPVQFELVDGERRYRACQALGRAFSAKVAIGLTPELQYLVSVALNFNREPHNPLETLLAIRNIRSVGHDVEATAKIIGLSLPTVYKYLRLLELDDRVLEQLGPPTPLEDRLGVSVAYVISSVRKELQWTVCHRLGKQPTVQQATTLVAKLLKEDATAGNPDSQPRRFDARDARLMLERLWARGEAVVSRVTRDAIQGIPEERRGKLHEQLGSLLETLELLRKELAVGRADEDAR
ncbi:MAG: ParB/RepB/Spo0J family partition protein [Bdellovibrionales bacterium]|nr:ParB/RepB/Spo0J family partition protein [Bdellovibrionales bacterium]